MGEVNITSNPRSGFACQSAKIVESLTFSASDQARFWAKVRQGTSGECWAWESSRTTDGYGQFALTIGPRKQRTLYAHRIAWELIRGPIPSGSSVLHRCDVPFCTNPDHLFLGDQTANMQDASRKGRLSIPRRRLRGIKPVVITRYLNGGISADALAAEYGIAKLTVLRWVHERVGTQDLRPGRSGNRAPQHQEKAS